MKIVFSIPVHERPEVVIDQIININTFNPEALIVLHINPKFDWTSEYISSENEFLQLVKGIPNVYVNTERVRAGWGDIIQTHMSNFLYMCGQVEFDYFVITASNELYIKKGFGEYISRYPAGVCWHTVADDSDWMQAKGARQDPMLMNMIKAINLNQYYGAQCEGTFYRKDVFWKMTEIILNFFDYRSINCIYAREEVYFPTVVKALLPDDKILQQKLTYMSWEVNLMVSCEDICDILDADQPYFSVKRVCRDIDNHVRCFVRQFIGNYQNQVQQLFSKQMPVADIQYITACDVLWKQEREERAEENKKKEQENNI